MEQGTIKRLTDRGFGFIAREGEEKDLAGDPILDAFSEDEPEPPKGSFDEDGNFLYDE